MFYIVFAGLYQLFLKLNITLEKPVDDITVLVSQQVDLLLQWLGDGYSINRVNFEPHVRLYHLDDYLFRVVEGCNAVSVIIMFAAFVFAFSTTLKKTISFIALGILAIHFFNVVRIALLTFAKVNYPTYNEILHDLVFPLIIYGFVVLLWLVWMNKFTKYVAQKK